MRIDIRRSAGVLGAATPAARGGGVTTDALDVAQVRVHRIRKRSDGR